MKLLILLVLLPFTTACFAGEIALSFDDAPTVDSAVMSGKVRTQRLIKNLQQHGVNQSIFYCTTQNLDNSHGRERLQAYAKAGHLLGNHSHSHASANQLSADAYLADVAAAHDKLKNLPGFIPLHRFPFLHYGDSPEKITALQIKLKEMGYQNGYVTVDNFDWYLNKLYVDAHSKGEKFDEQAFSHFYVETLLQAVAFYDEIARQTLGRSPRQVLLLHENDVSALFVGDLIEALRSQGWKIISPLQAYQDPIANQLPNTLFHKQGRVAALANAAGVPVESLRHPRESTETLDGLFGDLLTSNHTHD